MIGHGESGWYGRSLSLSGRVGCSCLNRESKSRLNLKIWYGERDRPLVQFLIVIGARGTWTAHSLRAPPNFEDVTMDSSKNDSTRRIRPIGFHGLK